MNLVLHSMPREHWQRRVASRGQGGRGEGAGRSGKRRPPSGEGLPGPHPPSSHAPTLTHTHRLLDPLAGLQPRVAQSPEQSGLPWAPRDAGARCGAELRVPCPFVDNSVDQLEFGRRLRGGPDVAHGHVAPPPGRSLTESRDPSDEC